MKRKALRIAILSAVHFLLCLVLGFFYYLTMLGVYLGREIESLDRLVARMLIILLFPVRNVVNLFYESPDIGMRNSSGIVFLLITSLLWGVSLYFGVSFIMRKFK